MAQVVEHLSNKCEALSSNPSTEKKKQNPKKQKNKGSLSGEKDSIQSHMKNSCK
jgi:hypothetical protein